ncbi:galactosyltransferase-like protein [Luteibacter rhizovicinus]|uniref:Galactosyltransferase-like protein n=1 Tax=Luteibacter rhizovicinus TaxID=242606 RepID=A0A4R3YTF9_9GAMM|nr:glycosyltransferase family 2 protein [Luteibacter rhizovicinus]TCV96315.1 galactosyltransferase-like protein [Luteibacter rhizovicinus]
MRITVAILTYNWPDALERVLESLARQTRLPDEVIVTDDGSGEATAEVMRRVAAWFPVRLVHLWQPDDGARMSRARNRAIAAATGDYIILLDGDMVAEPHFIADHEAFAMADCYVQGSRVLSDETLTRRMLADGTVRASFFTPGIERRRHTLRLPALARWYAKPSQKTRGIKSCNMGFWRDDLLRLNGFNESMTGWGREDTELVARAFHAGIRRRDLRFSALATHLYHRTRKNVVDNPNDRFLEDTRRRQLVRCDNGVDQHLAEFSEPPVDIRPRNSEQIA